MTGTMKAQSIPSAGLHLKYADLKRDGDAGPQIIRLDLLQKKTQELLQQLRDGKKVHLQTGKQAAVHYGKEKLALDTSSEAFPAEMYTRGDGPNDELYFAGKLSLHLEMSRARDDTAKADAALANLRSTLTSMREEQMQNGTTMLGVRPDKNGQLKPMQSRKEQLLGSNLSRPSSPFLGSAFSQAGPTSVPPGGSSNPRDKIRMEAMKIPVIHLLASKPMTTSSLAKIIRSSLGECEQLLNKVARDSTVAPGKKELKDKSYRDLDVWRFPYTQDSDRDAAVERAIHAFDRQRIDKTDNLWQLLLKPEERGKGKTLSRLNFDKPPAPPKVVDPAVSKGEMSDVEANPIRQKKNTNTAKVSEKKSLLKEPNVKPRAVSPAPTKKREAPTKSTSAEGKFKSAERIVDSDEEASTIEVVSKKPMTKNKDHVNVPRPSAHDRNPSPLPKKSAHKLSTSSSSSASDNSDSAQAKKSLKPPAKDTSSTAKSTSPRPRHGSSPQKPSPLGSSPPANSTDFDSSSSTTTKGTSQSSVPSSPDSDMPLSKQGQKYSPVVRDRDASQNTTTKRKPTDMGDGPPSKRQQVNGINGKINHNVTKPSERPHLKRALSESERSSSPEKPDKARDEVVTKAKRFKQYYKKYKDLHDRIASVPDKNRDPKDMDNLWGMHKRLRDMKTEIWNDWDSVDQMTDG